MSTAEVTQLPRRSDEEDRVLGPWLERYGQGTRDRQQYEYIWELCELFTQGYQWLGYDPVGRRVVPIRKQKNREQHTVDIMTKHLWTQQGKLSVDDLKPDILFRREDAVSRGYSDQAKAAFDWAWDNEFDADLAYMLASIKRLTYGLGFLRCRFDPLYGQIRDYVPIDQDGNPIAPDEEQLAELEQNGTLNGMTPKFKTVQEGRIAWEPGGPLNLVPPPGIQHESNFPWLIIERPVAIARLNQLWPETIGMEGESIRQVAAVGMDPRGGATRASSELKDHVILKTGYCVPELEYPRGQTVHWVKEQLLQAEDELPYMVRGQPKAGIVFLKYHVVDGRFWPKGLVQPAMGPQRQKNIARSNWLESMKRIGLPRVFATENSIVEGNVPEGLPAEVIHVRQGFELPKETQGVPPGTWLRDEADISERDMAMVTGTGEVSLSQVPTGVSAYSAFALFLEQDDRRIGPIRKFDRIAIAELSLYSLAGMKKYWPPEKHLAIKGEEGMLDTMTYLTSMQPDDVYTDITRTTPMPESQAAEAQKIMDVWNGAIAAGQPLPLDWLVESLNRKKMQPLPSREMQVQRDVAEMENHLIINGAVPMPAPYHNDELHVQIHRAVQQSYGLMGQGDPASGEVAMRFEAHIMLHVQSAQQKQARAIANQGGAPNQSPNQGGFGAVGAAQQSGAVR